MTYGDLYARLEPPASRPGASLWRRQMVLGPAPEFCLLAPGRLDLPRELAVTSLELDVLWPTLA